MLFQIAYNSLQKSEVNVFTLASTNVISKFRQLKN